MMSHHLYLYCVKGRFDGRWVHLGPEGKALNEQGGYGRPVGSGLRLSPEEALYLIHKQKISVEDYDFDALLAYFSDNPVSLRRFLVYRDIRERGYVIQPGPHDFRVFRRGERPPTGRSRYLVRVVSERNLIDLIAIAAEANSASNMRKSYVVAAVDDEGELTYYEVTTRDPRGTCMPGSPGRYRGTIIGTSVLVHAPQGSPLDEQWFGTRLDDGRLLLAPTEAGFLNERDVLSIESYTADEFRSLMEGEDREFPQKMEVYRDLRERGFIPRTGYKFGHHFRAYSGRKNHSEILVHAIGEPPARSMIEISGSVRLAHSVKKKMLFAIIHQNRIQYLAFTRIKL
ncbi:MAG: tRNA-intron lyase [Methanoculleaceae archaeon]